MQYVSFGKTGLKVSPVALGSWQLSPRFWGEIPESQIVQAIQAAADGGINFFDTADAYGDGYAETVLGKALRDRPRDQFVLATKWFNHFNADKTRFPDLRKEHIIARAEASLQRLQLEHVDIALLHFYDSMTPLDETAAAVELLQKQGKLRFAGVSNHSVEQLRAQRAFFDYSVVQPAYSLVEPNGESDLLPYCQSENLGVMIYSPLHKGLLTGKYHGTETFDDFRKGHPDFQGERFQGLCSRIQGLGALADKYSISIYQLVLAATLAHPAIQVAVCGSKSAEQITETIAAVGLQLDRQDVWAVRNAVGPSATKVADAKGSRK